MTLSHRIIDYRTRNEISQAKLAARVGLNRGTIVKAENGGSVSRRTEAKINLVLMEEDDDET